MLTVNTAYQAPTSQLLSDKFPGGNWLWMPLRDMCVKALAAPRLEQITPEEYAAMEIVAVGGVWPVPDKVYDGDDWERHGQFGAVPGQEVTEDIYEEMFNVLPILSLPRCGIARQYDCGWMVSEPATHDPQTGRSLYSAFGKRGGRFYYIGLLPRKVDDGDTRYD